MAISARRIHIGYHLGVTMPPSVGGSIGLMMIDG